DGGRVHVRGLLTLRGVHQLVGTLNELRGKLPRDAAPLTDRTEAQADDPDVDAHGSRFEPTIVTRPVVGGHRALEAGGGRVRVVAPGKVGNQEREFVAS